MASETNETREKSLNFLEEIIEESIAKGETRVQTRFPPEPNGYLHIGHAKSICINFGLAKKYGGKCNLRFDDTNPVKEDVEYVDSIKRDIHWLGFDWAVERYASDYFDQLYDWAVVLIKKGLAYVDDQTQEQIRENRGTVSVPGTPSPWRDRSVEENLDLFERMKNGEFPEGSRTLRAKIDLASGNFNMRDPVIYRINHMHHHRLGQIPGGGKQGNQPRQVVAVHGAEIAEVEALEQVALLENALFDDVAEILYRAPHPGDSRHGVPYPVFQPVVVF